jgi:hypothetical protein
MGKLSEKQFEDAKKEWVHNVYAPSNTPEYAIRNVLEAVAPYMQYETTEPGAPLINNEWDTVLSNPHVARPAPAEVDGDVIEGMEHARLSSPGGPKERMTAAAKVLRDALRGPMTAEEESAWKKYNYKHDSCEPLRPLWFGPWLINYRIEHRILKTKEKTFREKVKDILSRRTNSFPVDVDKISEEIDSLREKSK